MKKLTLAIALAIVMASSAFAEYGLKWTRDVKHITTKTTTNVTTVDTTLHTLIITASNAGTGWTISVQDKATTPHILYAGTVAAAVVVIELPVGIKMFSGIDIVTAGTTAGTMDVWLAYH